MLADKFKDFDQRLKDLEARRNTNEKPITKPNNNLINTIENYKSMDVNLIVNEIEESYLKGIENNNLNIDNTPKLIEYTIIYVENNWVKFKSLFNLDSIKDNNKSNFKLQLALDLIEQFVKGLDKKIIIDMINEIVLLLFNRNKYEEAIEKEKDRRRHKSRGSIRKMRKFLLPFNND